MNFNCVILLLLVFTVASAEQAYQRVSRDTHNALRKKHRVSALSVSEDLNSRAVKCALYYANKGTIDHSCPHKNKAGENIYAMWGGTPSNDDVAKRSTNSWYAEISKHDFKKDWQPPTGHFTQLVWKGSKQVGFGIGKKGTMVVGCALYSPAGNIMTQFKDNVLKP